ncbi:Imm1 family immunity protein [Nocardiopsis tropica]|uniref:Imm1 family immunity protein n=1 Tax=Nocardiopsis tropica TaxID=109330 RepID=A0ABU7KP14_9ACTN|nr:Imm1 family immunity protein [Nocardiopsis umidischolae]MEE2050872.1 Imm1 family immunity protein [Nocardiopsis umidischolae]
MFQSAFFKGEWHYCESSLEDSLLIPQAINGLQGEREVGGAYFPGEDAWFCLTGRRKTDVELVGGSRLRLAVNPDRSYGALVWCVDDKFPRKGGVYDYVWISDKPEPLDFDPRVVSDPGYPLFHDPASALPISQIQAAVEEFFRLASGARPECIKWVSGEVNGQRLDRPPIVDYVVDPDIDWDSLR